MLPYLHGHFVAVYAATSDADERIATQRCCPKCVCRYDKKTNATQKIERRIVIVLCCSLVLAAAHTVAAVEALVAGTAADGDMATGVAGGCIALHIFSRCIYRIQ